MINYKLLSFFNSFITSVFIVMIVNNKMNASVGSGEDEDGPLSLYSTLADHIMLFLLRYRR